MDGSRQRLTPRQKEILVAIRDYWAEHEMAPGLRDIGREVGIKSTSVVEHHIHVLAGRGLIRRNPVIARALWLTDDGQAALDAEVSSPA